MSNKLTIIYKQEGGQVFSDGVIEEIALKHWKAREAIPVITISTSLLITAFRVHMVEGTIPSEDLIFCYKGEVVHIDARGSAEYWPVGFDDTAEKLLMRLMTGQGKMETRRLHNQSMAGVMEKEPLLTIDEIVRVTTAFVVDDPTRSKDWQRIPGIALIKAIRNTYGTTLKSSKEFYDEHKDAYISELCLQNDRFKVYYWENEQH